MRDSSKNIGVGGESASVSRENVGVRKFGSASGKIYHSVRDETVNLGVDESLIYGENQRSDGVSRGFPSSDSEAEQNKRSAFSQSEKCFLENKRSGDTHEVRGVFLASKAKQSKTKTA